MFGCGLHWNVFIAIQFINSLRPRQDGRYFADDIFKCIFLNETVWIPFKISLKGPMNNIPALVQIMAWRRPGDKPLSEPMMVSLPTHICVTRPQWVNRQQWSQTLAPRQIDGLPFRKAIMTRVSDALLCHWRKMGCLSRGDFIYRCGSWSISVGIMAWCRQAANHYLHRCWLSISKYLRTHVCIVENVIWKPFFQKAKK